MFVEMLYVVPNVGGSTITAPTELKLATGIRLADKLNFSLLKRTSIQKLRKTIQTDLDKIHSLHDNRGLCTSKLIPVSHIQL